jgi:CCR4-NOT transcriptional regulation complex NOT5 subunit
MKKTLLLAILLTSCASKRTKVESIQTTQKDSIHVEQIKLSTTKTRVLANFTGGDPLQIDTPTGRLKISGSGNVSVEQISNTKESDKKAVTSVVYKDRVVYKEKVTKSKSLWWFVIVFVVGVVVGWRVKF